MVMPGYRSFDESSSTFLVVNSVAGVMKPDVVFFGESVPPERVQHCRDLLSISDAVLVVGSSLMVFSGFRFVREALQQGLPVVAINRGRTRADELLTQKFDLDCSQALMQAVRHVDSREPQIKS